MVIPEVDVLKVDTIQIDIDRYRFSLTVAHRIFLQTHKSSIVISLRIAITLTSDLCLGLIFKVLLATVI